MRLLLTSKLRSDAQYEVVSYDAATHTATLKRKDGSLMVDTNFHIDMIKRAYELTRVT